MTATESIEQRAGDLSLEAFSERLQSGLGLRIGPFKAYLQILCPEIAATLHSLYRDYPLLTGDHLFSFHARLENLRRKWLWGQRKVRFSVDGRVPHEEMPAAQALAVLEWGINLVIALRSHNFLMLHSAALERNGQSMLLPAAPGSGKTTLCTALAFRDWRLFSDEFGLLRLGQIELTPIPRPMALKNESIEVVRNFEPAADLGPSIANTRKGTVAHVRPPTESVVRVDEGAPVRWIVYPKWREGAACSLLEMPKVESFMELATNAFNYELLGEEGFETVRKLIEASRSFRLEYSNLDDAITALDSMTESSDV